MKNVFCFNYSAKIVFCSLDANVLDGDNFQIRLNEFSELNSKELKINNL